MTKKFEVDKQYKAIGRSTQRDAIYTCPWAGETRALLSWMVNGSECMSLEDQSALGKYYEEYTPPVIVERYMGIYPPTNYIGQLVWDTLEEARKGVAKNALGIAKYVYTDGRITSITIADWVSPSLPISMVS